MDAETQVCKDQQSVEGQLHLPSQPAAENLSRGAMVIPMPNGEDEPSSDHADTGEEEAIIDLMPCQWQKHYRGYKHLNRLCQQGGFLQFVGCTNLVKRTVAQWKALTGQSKAISEEPRGTLPNVEVRTEYPKLIRQALPPTRLHVSVPTYVPESFFKVPLTLVLQEGCYEEAEGEDNSELSSSKMSR